MGQTGMPKTPTSKTARPVLHSELGYTKRKSKWFWTCALNAFIEIVGNEGFVRWFCPWVFVCYLAGGAIFSGIGCFFGEFISGSNISPVLTTYNQHPPVPVDLPVVKFYENFLNETGK